MDTRTFRVVLMSAAIYSSFSYAGGPQEEARSLTVEPRDVYLGIDRELITVSVRDMEGNPVANAPVDLVSADPELAFFPFSRAYTASDGRAYAVLESRIIENDWEPFETTFSVSSGTAAAGPFRVVGLEFHGDGPYGFEAPPLEPFAGPEQRLVGTLTNLFELLSVGDKVSAWSIDPTVAEIAEGTVIETRERLTSEAVVEFPVTAFRTGQAVFIIGTVDRTLYVSDVTGDLSPPRFLRGDCNGDASFDISDVIMGLNALFHEGVSMTCRDACDSNDDGQVDISDPITSLSVMFLGQGTMPPPGSSICGIDPTADDQTCEAQRSCP